MTSLGDAGERPRRCSAAGCRAEAAWSVAWRNPRIHGPERVKLWLACETHRETLGDYLRARGFPVVVTKPGVPVEALP